MQKVHSLEFTHLVVKEHHYHQSWEFSINNPCYCFTTPSPNSCLWCLLIKHPKPKFLHAVNSSQIWSSHHSLAERNLTSVRTQVIPGLDQWVKDPELPWAVGHRCGSDLVLLWLWHRPVVLAQIRCLAWEPPYAVGAALKLKKKKFLTNLLFLCLKGIKASCFGHFLSPISTRPSCTWVKIFLFLLLICLVSIYYYSTTRIQEG